MSNNLQLSQVTTGQDNKEATINTQSGELDAALTEALDVDLTSGNVALTATQQAQNMIYSINNATVTGRTVTLLAQKKVAWVRMASTTTETVDLIVGATTLVMALDTDYLVYTDGTANGLIAVVLGSTASGATQADWKDSVVVATTVTGVLATAYENGDTIDGVVLVTGDRILLKDQTAGAENGIYTVEATGAPTRSTDADANSEVTSGLTVFVSEGTANGGKMYQLTTVDPIVVGSTALVFTEFSGGGASAFTGLTDAPSSYAAGDSGKRVAVNNGETAVEFVSPTLGLFAAGVPTNAEVVAVFTFTEDFVLPASLTGSQGKLLVAPTANAAWTLRKNGGASLGTVNFAAAATTPTFTFTTETAFVPGDYLTVENQAVADATMAGASISLKGK